MTSPPLPTEFAFVPVLLAGITSWLTDEDLERFIGPWGGFVVSLLLCALLLRHSAKRIKREDDRASQDSTARERMHKENLEAMKETHSKFEKMANHQMDAQLETAKAMLKLSHSCETLHQEMRSRKCLLDGHKTPH